MATVLNCHPVVNLLDASVLRRSVHPMTPSVLEPVTVSALSYPMAARSLSASVLDLSVHQTTLCA